MMLIVSWIIALALVAPMHLFATETIVQAKPAKAHPGKYDKSILAAMNDRDQDIEFNFNNASLKNITSQIETMFNIVFLPDDALKGGSTDSQTLADSKISFNTYRPMSKRRAWDLYQTLLGLAGFAVVATNDPKIFRITAIQKANRSPLPMFFNAPLELVPDNDSRIRYVITLTNSTPDQMKNLLDKLKSATALIEAFQELKAIILTDTAYNVKSIVKIITELDRTNVPQVLSVLKLRQADADEVADLIKQLQGKDDPAKRSGFAKKSSALYFIPQEVQVISEPRSNSLVIIGPKNAVARIEQVIQEQIDTALKEVYQPVHTYSLNYAPAQQVADIMNSVLKYGQDTSAGKAGGVRGGEKYFANVFIQAEPQGNRLIIRSSKTDFEHLKKIIAQLDQRQPQVAIEVLIISLRLDEIRQLGIQWDSKNDRKINVQMSGFLGNSGPVINTSTGSIIANLLSLAQGAPIGSTVVSFGQQSVWAIFAAVQTLTESRVVSNPFLVATNKYQASVAIGETRRVQIGQIQGSNNTPIPQYGNIDANLVVTATPQINSMGIITLDINVAIEQFTRSFAEAQTNPSAGNTDKRSVTTTANLADSEVLALGGLVRTTQNNNGTRFPLLYKIPIIGRLFSNQKKETVTDNLIIFICPKIIRPDTINAAEYTSAKQEFAKEVVGGLQALSTNERDPIYNWFFKPITKESDALVDDFFADKRPVQHSQSSMHGAISAGIAGGGAS
ncbi:hypothetical protein M1466_00055 [Candidatus Dependentiae bacterium]|nr:hypothetical protein [Candidatus Dependentiae bacterium]